MSRDTRVPLILKSQTPVFAALAVATPRASPHMSQRSAAHPTAFHPLTAAPRTHACTSQLAHRKRTPSNRQRWQTWPCYRAPLQLYDPPDRLPSARFAMMASLPRGRLGHLATTLFLSELAGSQKQSQTPCIAPSNPPRLPSCYVSRQADLRAPPAQGLPPVVQRPCTRYSTVATHALPTCCCPSEAAE